ncbi:hypothetical protein ACFYZ9_35355 [Streptomyces sp. NPDC001691]
MEDTGQSLGAFLIDDLGAVARALPQAAVAHGEDRADNATVLVADLRT